VVHNFLPEKIKKGREIYSRPLCAKNKKAVKIPEALHGYNFILKKISGGQSSL